jgi:hypothetical protein
VRFWTFLSSVFGRFSAKRDQNQHKFSSKTPCAMCFKNNRKKACRILLQNKTGGNLLPVGFLSIVSTRFWPFLYYMRTSNAIFTPGEVDFLSAAYEKPTPR